MQDTYSLIMFSEPSKLTHMHTLPLLFHTFTLPAAEFQHLDSIAHRTSNESSHHTPRAFIHSFIQIRD